MALLIFKNSLISILLIILFYLTNFPSFIEALNCTATDIICVPTYKYDIRLVRFYIITTKECDICVGFTCLIDQEKFAVGLGCAEDFEKYCPNATFNVDPGNKHLTQGDNHGHSVTSCKVRDKCNNNFFGFMEDSSNYGMFGNGLIFGKKFKEIDSCTPPNNNGLMDKINGFKIFGMIIIGFVLFKCC